MDAVAVEQVETGQPRHLVALRQGRQAHGLFGFFPGGAACLHCNFWVDWKDRRMWPTVVPILGVTFAAATQAFFWVNFRLPFGAVFAALGLLIGEWINRYVNFWGWTYFPISLVFPSALIVPAIWLDVILLLSGS